MRERGAVLVEMALVVPLLLLVVAGVADLGRAYFIHAAVQEAAQEGAIYAAFHPADPMGARMATIDTVDFPSLSLADVTVTCPAPNQVAVTVSYSMALITPIMRQFAGGAVDLVDTETAHVLQSTPCTASP